MPRIVHSDWLPHHLNQMRLTVPMSSRGILWIQEPKTQAFLVADLQRASETLKCELAHHLKGTALP